MTQPLTTSVIIPVFRRLDYLGDALDSVAAQTLLPHEVIVVSDGGHSDPAPVAERCSIPVTVIARDHGGPGAARNTGCSAATGNLLAFLDCDDVWRPEKLELQVGAFARDERLDMAFAGVIQFYSPELDREGSPTVSARVERAERAGLLPSAFVVRSESFARVGGFREGVIFGEFLDWYARAMELELRGVTVDHTLVERRVHNHNAGVEFRDSRSDYVHVIRDLLDRRRRDGYASIANPS